MKYILASMGYKVIYTEYISVLGFIWFHLAVFVFLVMFQYFFSSTLRKAADKALQQTLRSILFGIAFFIAIPLISILLIASLIGIPLGLLLLLVYAFLVLSIIFITSVSVANLVNRFGNLKWGLWLLSFLSLAVFLVIMLLLRIPILGWVVLGLLSCLTLGSLLDNINWHRISEKLHLNIN